MYACSIDASLYMVIIRHSGFKGVNCREKVPEVGFGRESFVKVALSFAPEPLKTSVQFRLRTKQSDGLFLQMMSQQNSAAVIVEVGKWRYVFACD